MRRYLRRILVALGVAIAARGRGFRVENREGLGRVSRPFLLLCNHAALVDSLYLIHAMPEELTICGARPVYFEGFFKRQLMSLLSIIKVENQQQFVNDCGRLISGGRSLLIYPEMGRNKKGMGRFETWAAEVALQSAVPVVPCYLYGTTEGQTGTVELTVGESLSPEQGDNEERLTDRFFARIQALSERAVRRR